MNAPYRLRICEIQRYGLTCNESHEQRFCTGFYPVCRGFESCWRHRRSRGVFAFTTVAFFTPVITPVITFDREPLRHAVNERVKIIGKHV